MTTDRALRSRRARPLATSTGLALLVVGVAHAETLPNALARAYAANPDLLASRAALRAVDEEVAVARGAYRPTLSVDGQWYGTRARPWR